MSEEANSEEKTWRDDDRVTVTPTHFEIQIYKWAPHDDPERARAERENPPMAPPDKVSIRRSFTAGDAVRMDEYPDTGQRSRELAICCILTGNNTGGGRVSADMMGRMSYQDYQIVIQATDDAVAGKD